MKTQSEDGLTTALFLIAGACVLILVLVVSGVLL